jgi:asparagine synthase (glutamine-hydrolysing)
MQFTRATLSLPGVSPVLIAQALEPAVPRGLRGIARRLVGRPLLPPWIDAQWFRARQAFATSRALPGGSHPFHNALVQGLTETVLPALLRYGDRNSMAFSIESRVPFLTPQLADLAYSLPAAQLVDDSATSKAVLRAAMRGIVPEQILARRDKVAFATPDELWARALKPWFARTLSSEAARSLPWLKADVALQALERRTSRSQPFGFDFWRTVNVVRWIERFDVARA